MSDYKEYRPKTRTLARVLTDDVKVVVGVEDGQIKYDEMKAGDYEIRLADGSLGYQHKAEFEAHNEPVRRERQPKQSTTKPAKKKTATEKATAATPSNVM